MPMRPSGRRVTAMIALAGISLAVATALAAILESPTIGMQDASPVYLIAVVITGSAFGTGPAITTAIAASLLYDVLFTAPRFSFAIADPREWLDLLLFLFVAIAIGRLVAVQHRRTEEAGRREREAASLFGMSRVLATAPSTEEAAAEIVRRLTRDAHLERSWIISMTAGQARVIADSDPGSPPPDASVAATLVHLRDDDAVRWVRLHEHRHTDRGSVAGEYEQVTVRLEADGVELGTLVGTRERAAGLPGFEESRILALAADQIALALRRDQLRRAATELEIAREGDTLKTALVDSVSHDLRTPLASIRATASGLADPDVPWSEEASREAAVLIDAEAARLDRLVRGVLDLSRIESGALHPDLEPHDLASIAEAVIDRVRPGLGDHTVKSDIPGSLPPVLVDAVLLDVVITNLIENAVVHGGPGTAVRLDARAGRGEWVALEVNDSGHGVPDAELPRLFDRFHRVKRSGEGSRRGLGIGLSVVKGLCEAMGGSVSAQRSPMGGLALTVSLRTAPSEPER